MKTKLFLFLLLAVFSNGYSQKLDPNTGILIGNYKSKKLLNKLDYIAIDVGYSKPNFYSEVFNQNMNEGLIDFNFGAGVSLKYFYYNLIIVDLGYKGGFFSSILTNKSIYFQQSDIGISLFVPYLNNTAIKPYIGTERSSSQLSGSKSSLNISQQTWKIGTIVDMNLLHDEQTMLYLICEYKQPFDFSNEYKYNLFTLGVGFKGGVFIHK